MKRAPICTPDSMIKSEDGIGQSTREEEEEGNKRTVSRIRRVLSVIGMLVTSHLGLFFLLLGYTFAGAAVFHAIEDNIAWSLANSTLARLETATSMDEDEFRRVFAVDTVNAWRWGNAVASVQDVYDLLERYENEVNDLQEIRDKEKRDYWSWMLFCMTVYSTIGKIWI